MLRLRAKSKLREIREKFGTQKDLISLVQMETGQDISRPFYTLVENGQRGIDPEMAIAIAKILKVDIEEVFENAKGIHK